MPIANGITHRSDCYAVGMAASTITFFESSGHDARSALASYGARIARAGIPCELMASTSQDALFLLVCRGEPPREDAPEDAKVWTFEPVETFR